MDFSTASVFEETNETTGYKWDDESDFESSDSEQGKKPRLRVSDLKRALSEDEMARSGAAAPWQSTPQVNHLYKMSGSTIGNDFADKFEETPSRLDAVNELDEISQTETLRDQLHMSHERQSGKQSKSGKNMQSGQPKGQHLEHEDQDHVQKRQADEFEENFEKPFQNHHQAPNSQTMEGEVESSPDEDLAAPSNQNSQRSPSPSSNQQFADVSFGDKPPHFISNLNSLPERVRNDVMNYISASLAHGPPQKPQPPHSRGAMRNPEPQKQRRMAQPPPHHQRQQKHSNNNVNLTAGQNTNEIRNEKTSSDRLELERLRAFLNSSEEGEQLLHTFESENQKQQPHHTRRIGPSLLPKEKLYHQLEMDKVDTMPRVELENLVKNSLLQLGIPLSKLPVGISAIARTLYSDDSYRQFASDVHETIYKQHMRGSDPQCLQNMLEYIKLNI